MLTTRQYVKIVLLIMLLGLVIIKFTSDDAFSRSKRKAFIEFLQLAVERGGEDVPLLSAQQKKKFGGFTHDYQILVSFMQEKQNLMIVFLPLAITLINEIKTPTDYVIKKERMALVAFQLSELRNKLKQAEQQANIAYTELKQPSDIKKIYAPIYTKTVSQAVERLDVLILPTIDVMEAAIKAGNLIESQGKIINDTVQFSSMDNVEKYNQLMNIINNNQHVIPVLQDRLNDYVK